MTLPCVDDFRERFPEFEATSDATIELAIEDAGDEIDEDIWMEKDYANGVLFLAAHFLVAGTTQGEATTEGGYVRSESIGRISTSYGDQVMSASTANGTFATEYGNRYKRLLRRNAPRIAVI